MSWSFRKDFGQKVCICCNGSQVHCPVSLTTKMLKPKAQVLFTPHLRTKALFNHTKKAKFFLHLSWGKGTPDNVIVLNRIHQVHQWRKSLAGTMCHMHWRSAYKLGTYKLWMIKQQESDTWKYSQHIKVCAPHKILQWASVASPGGNTALNSDLCQALGSGSALTHALTPRAFIILDICMGVVMFPQSLFYWELVKLDWCQHTLAAEPDQSTFTTQLSILPVIVLLALSHSMYQDSSHNSCLHQLASHGSLYPVILTPNQGKFLMLLWHSVSQPFCHVSSTFHPCTHTYKPVMYSASSSSLSKCIHPLHTELNNSTAQALSQHWAPILGPSFTKAVFC